jgi:NAD(P)-dependent dehydrogenase (short-subunit alcohol dehydrogenase family)
MKIDGVAAVTGAGAGLGLGIAKALAQRGVDVLALVLEDAHVEAVQKELADASGALEVSILDVTRIGDFAFPDDLQVLVNNAGVRLSSRPIEAIESDEWRRTMDVNFFGMVDLTRLALPIMRHARRGVICNVSSGSLFAATPFLGAYRASKAAISAFSETLRIEVAPFGIRVVEIMPGAVKTGMNVDSILNKIADTSGCPASKRPRSRPPPSTTPGDGSRTRSSTTLAPSATGATNAPRPHSNVGGPPRTKSSPTRSWPPSPASSRPSHRSSRPAARPVAPSWAGVERRTPAKGVRSSLKSRIEGARAA